MRTLNSVVIKVNTKSTIVKLENGMQVETTLLKEAYSQWNKVGKRLRVGYDFTRREIKSVWNI
jgi:hypothetical protein